MKQTISDIIDQHADSADPADRLRRIASDPDGCRTWRNFHLIGDVIRGDVRATGGCLIERVQASLESEPTVLAPSGQAPAKASTDTAAGPGGSRSDTLKAAGLFSLAASIALVAVLTAAPETADPQRENAVAATVTPAGTASGAVVQPEITPPESDAIAAEFGQMLVEHGEFTTTAGLNGLLAYAKLVSNQPIAE